MGKSVSLRTRARAHFCAPAGLDRARRGRGLQADQLGARRARAREPADQAVAPAGQRASSSAPTATCTCAAGSTSRTRCSRWRRSRRRASRSTSGPVRGAASRPRSWSTSSSRCSGCATAAGRCSCREHPSAYGQMGRCLSPCLGDLDPNAYRRRLDEALAPFTGDGDGGEALLDADRRADAARPRPTRATSGRPRCCAGASGWRGGRRGCRGCSRRPTRGPRLVLARHPVEGALGRVLDRRGAAWSTGAPLPDPRRARRAHRARAGVAPRAARAGDRRAGARWTRSGSCTRGSPRTTRRGYRWPSRCSTDAVADFAGEVTRSALSFA